MRTLLVLTLTTLLLGLATPGSATVLFEENFSNTNLQNWTGKNNGVHSGTVGSSSGTNFLMFTSTTYGGDIFTVNPFSSSTGQYQLTFDYRGTPADNDVSGGFIGYSYDTSGSNFWLAGTDPNYVTTGPKTILQDSVEWKPYTIYFTTTLNNPIRLMLEDFHLSGKSNSSDTAGDAHFRNITLTSIPLPKAFWLLGTGLLGLMGFRRLAS